MQNKTKLFSILFLVMAVAVSGCGLNESLKPVANNNDDVHLVDSDVNEIANQNQSASSDVSDVDENQGAGAGEDEVVDEAEEVDTSDWLTYRNEEYGFEVRYPGGWNIYNASQFSEYDQERGVTEMGFTYDEIVEGVRPMDNMVSAKIIVVDYEEDHFKNIKEECLKQEICNKDCEPGITCYNWQEILVDNKEAIKYNYLGLGYGNPIGQAIDIKLNKNKILYIRYVSKTDIEEYFSEDNKIRIEKEMRDVNKILSTVKIW